MKEKGSTIDNMLTTYNVICFSYLPWSQMWKRNQSMMAQIARFEFVNKLIFVNPVNSPKQTSTENQYQKEVSLRTRNRLLSLNTYGKIEIFSPRRFIPFKKYLLGAESIEDFLFYYKLKWMNQNQPVILVINDPIKSPGYVIKKFQKIANLSIFDFSDDFVEYFRNDTDPRRSICNKNIESYAGSASIVIAVNNHLKEKYGYLNNNFEVLRNATNYKNFDRNSYAQIDFLEEIKANDMPIVGYTGGIRNIRIDFSLLDYILKEKSTWQFVFIGDADTAFKKHYSKVKNLHLFSPVEYDILPDCLHYFDLAIVPFQRNEHTKGNDLLKLYDYLAMGKPVVSTKIGGAEDLKGIIEIADTALEFVAKMESAFRSNNDEAVRRRKSIAMKNSWTIRINDLKNLINKQLQASSV